MTRKEAIDIIKRLAWHERPNEEDIEQAIKALKQEPKTGHWIYTGLVCQTDEILYGYGCSKCGAISFFRKSDNKILGGKWCHYCGAKMEEQA